MKNGGTVSIYIGTHTLIQFPTLLGLIFQWVECVAEKFTCPRLIIESGECPCLGEYKHFSKNFYCTLQGFSHMIGVTLDLSHHGIPQTSNFRDRIKINFLNAANWLPLLGCAGQGPGHVLGNMAQQRLRCGTPASRQCSHFALKFPTE